MPSKRLADPETPPALMYYRRLVRMHQIICLNFVRFHLGGIINAATRQVKTVPTDCVMERQIVDGLGVVYHNITNQCACPFATVLSSEMLDQAFLDPTAANNDDRARGRPC